MVDEAGYLPADFSANGTDRLDDVFSKKTFREPGGGSSFLAGDPSGIATVSCSLSKIVLDSGSGSSDFIQTFVVDIEMSRRLLWRSRKR